jgi:hypothetical protein
MWTSSLHEQTRDSNSSRAPKFCCPPNARETKRESREARSGYRITCPRGIRGWPAYEDRDRKKAIKRWGIPQDVDAEPSIHITHTLELEHKLSLSLAQHFLFQTIVLQMKPGVARISFFLFLMYNAQLFEYFLFLFANLIIYIEIWHASFNKNFFQNVDMDAS